jgi:hypothetical protein
MEKAFVLAVIGSAFIGMIPCQEGVFAEPLSKTIVAQVNKTTKVPILMPTSGTVVFKNGTSTAGTIVYDAKQKRYFVGKKSYPASEVIKIIPKNSRYFIVSQGGIVIRGEDNSVVEPETWMKIPLDNLQMLDSKTGLAEVDLVKSFDRDRISDIRSVAQSSQYVVSEISIDPKTGDMNIKVVPIDSVKPGKAQ